MHDTPIVHLAALCPTAAAYRSYLSRHGMRTPAGDQWRKKRELIAPLVGRGTPSEIATYLKIHHNIVVTTNSVKKVVYRIRAKQKAA